MESRKACKVSGHPSSPNLGKNKSKRCQQNMNILSFFIFNAWMFFCISCIGIGEEITFVAFPISNFLEDITFDYAECWYHNNLVLGIWETWESGSLTETSSTWLLEFNLFHSYVGIEVECVTSVQSNNLLVLSKYWILLRTPKLSTNLNNPPLSCKIKYKINSTCVLCTL